MAWPHPPLARKGASHRIAKLTGGCIHCPRWGRGNRPQSLLSPATALQNFPPSFLRGSQYEGCGGGLPVWSAVSQQSLGRLKRTWTMALGQGSPRWAMADRPHCCLQADSRRILPLAEQAFRAGLEAALARRSALDLVLSCTESVPFMHMFLGRPRLCPF